MREKRNRRPQEPRDQAPAVEPADDGGAEVGDVIRSAAWRCVSGHRQARRLASSWVACRCRAIARAFTRLRRAPTETSRGTSQARAPRAPAAARGARSSAISTQIRRRLAERDDVGEATAAGSITCGAGSRAPKRAPACATALLSSSVAGTVRGGTVVAHCDFGRCAACERPRQRG